MTDPETANPGATHYEGCWRTRGHHDCAIAEVERTEARLALANAEIRALRKSTPPHDCPVWPVSALNAASVPPEEAK